MAYPDQTPRQGDFSIPFCIRLVLKPSLQTSCDVSRSGTMSGRKPHGNSAVNACQELAVATLQVRIENSHVHGITQAMVSSADLPNMRWELTAHFALVRSAECRLCPIHS
jgi:hypothetical protein